MFSYKEEECDRYAMRWGGCPFLFDKDMMFPVKEGIFEGKKAMIPNKCSDYLIWHYGDEWSYMPPHDKREGHVAVCVDDLPYQELREEYMPKINKERLRWDSVFRKFYNMRIAKKSHKVRQDGLAMKARAVALDLQRAIDESGLKISELVESRSFRKLSALFGSYYKNQLSADFIGREDYTNIYAFYHPILVEIPDDIFYAAMLTLFYTERVSKAYRMLQIRKQWDHLSSDMEKLKEDIELFRKAADHYEFHRMKEAEQIISDLLQKYPGHPGFMKFKCRFLMEDAGENRIEAERFLDKALKMFPEDGYFLKYKADILWMDGEMQKAAELYLQVKNKTTNGIVWMEMDRFFRGYKSEILKSCEELIANHNKKEALALMELWSRLIPEDDDIQGALYLAKTVCARTQSEIEKEIGEIRAVIGTQMITPVSVEKNPGKSRKQIKSDRTSDETSADDVNKKVSDPSAETEEVKAPADIQVKVSEEHKMYRKALTRAWKRLGYSNELAELRTQIICTGEESELEWLAEQVRNRQFRREEKACAYKLVGDVRMKQGQTREAFANYKKALEAGDDVSDFKDIFLGDKQSLEQYAFHHLKNRQEISNQVFIMGTLCMEPEYYANEDSRLQTCQFPIASNRLRRIKEDGADKKTDYPWVKCFGPMAEQHSICLHTNSTIYINGAIEARDIEIEMCCEQCQQNFLAKSSSIEIVPYHIEYIDDCIIPESDRAYEEDGLMEGEAYETE